MANDETIELILFLTKETNFNFEDNGYTLEEIKDFLEINKIKISKKKLQKILDKMEKEKLIEERHFQEEYNYRIDYSIEKEGINFLKNIK